MCNTELNVVLREACHTALNKVLWGLNLGAFVHLFEESMLLEILDNFR